MAAAIPGEFGEETELEGQAMMVQAVEEAAGHQWPADCGQTQGSSPTASSSLALAESRRETGWGEGRNVHV